MSKLSLLIGFAVGAVVGATVGRETVNKLRSQAMDAWERPEVQRVVRKADQFVADKAPTLHGVGGAVADSVTDN